MRLRRMAENPPHQFESEGAWHNVPYGRLCLEAANALAASEAARETMREALEKAISLAKGILGRNQGGFIKDREDIQTIASLTPPSGDVSGETGETARRNERMDKEDRLKQRVAELETELGRKNDRLLLLENVIDTLTAERDALRERVEELKAFADHWPSCTEYQRMLTGCICGLTALQNRITPPTPHAAKEEEKPLSTEWLE